MYVGMNIWNCAVGSDEVNDVVSICSAVIDMEVEKKSRYCSLVDMLLSH